MIANTKTIAFLLFTLCSIGPSVHGQALSTKTPSPVATPVTNIPTATPTGSSAPVMILDEFKSGNGSKLSKKTRSPDYRPSGKASKLVASRMSGKSGKGKTYAPVAGKGKGGKGKGGKGKTNAPVVAFP